MQTFRRIQRALGTNLATSGFTAKSPTTTKPSGNTIIDMTRGGIAGVTPDAVLIQPIGAGSDNDVFSLRLWGWHHIGDGRDKTDTLWVPMILAEFVCTLSGAVGVANSPVLSTERFADTIAPVAARLPDAVIAAGTAVNSPVLVNSPVGDIPAYAIVPMLGAELLEFDEDQTTGTPTANALIRFIDNWEW